MKKYFPYYSFAAFIIIIFYSLSSCDESPNSTPRAGTAEEIAETHCTRCHQMTSPALLDKTTWTNKVLPAMAVRMGIGVWQENQYYDRNDGKASISMNDWEKLVDYFVANAPDSLVSDSSILPVSNDWAIFKLKTPNFDSSDNFSVTTVVKVDTLHKVIFSGNGRGELMRWNRELSLKDSIHLLSPPVDINSFQKDNNTIGLLITCIGSLNAIDVALGEIWEATEQPLRKMAHLADSLPRPVETIETDIDKDGVPDYIICGFGHEKGSLFLLQKNSQGRYDRKILSELPGATREEVTDYNNDGWPDILVLFAQAREGVWLFLNDGKGGFETKNLIEFPPVYGSTGFQFVDMNNDGRKDFVYTCGDNADYSPILKPYHGIYIFMNRGNDRYEQTRFYHVDGCTKAIVADFDQDGDMDIASIAFFPDMKLTPGESMLYFEQNGSMEFKIHSIPVGKAGRWICQDVGDYDSDGDLDIILGNYSRGFGMEPNLVPDWDTKTPFVILENVHPK